MTIDLYYSCDLFLMFWLLIRLKKRKRERREKKKEEERRKKQKKRGKRQNDFFRLSATGWTELNREIKSNVRG